MDERLTDRQSRVALWVGAGVSVAVHALAMVVVVGPSLGGSRASAEQPVVANLLFETPPVRLGEDRGSPTAIAWLGYEEYRRHVAQPWHQDQAAFSPSAANAQPQPPAPDAVPMSAAEPQPPAPNHAAELVEAAEAPAEPSASPAASDAASPVEAVDAEALVQAVQAAADRAAAMVENTIAAIGEAGQVLIRPRQEANPVELAGAEQPDDGQGAASQDAEVSETVISHNDEVSEAQPGVGEPARVSESETESAQRAVERISGSGQPGDPQDREATAASIERATRWEIGQPLAAAGLRIATVPPRLTPLTRVTSRPKDPVVRIRFGRTGRVVSAEFLRSSGHRDVDQPILDAVYRWRATGKALEALETRNSSDSLVVDIRISL